MLHNLSEEGDDVIVIHEVKDLLTVFAGPNQAQLAQAAQVMRDGRLADAHDLGECADIDLAFHQRRQDAHTAGVAECPEELGHPRGDVLVERMINRCPRNLGHTNI